MTAKVSKKNSFSTLSYQVLWLGSGIRLPRTIPLGPYKDVDRYKEVFAVGIGRGLDYANYRILADTVNAHAKKYGTDSITFTVDKDGVYNIGFHAISAGHQSYIYLDNISLMEATSTGISSVITGDNDFDDSKVYTTSGIYLGKAADVFGSMPRGTYIIRKGGKSIKILK